LMGGTPEQRPQNWRDASPVTLATRPLPPTLMIYGTRDFLIAPQTARVGYEKLRAAQTPVVFLQMPWASHGLDLLPQSPSGQLSLYYTERFLAWALRNT